MKLPIKKSEYDLQAEKFLEDTATTLTALYTGHRPYFQDDKEYRATFQVTLANKKGVHSFQFGQSIAESYKLRNGKAIPQVDWNDSHVKRMKATGQPTSYYPKGKSTMQDVILNRTAPKPYDILACLTPYDPETFDDFCSNYGYDIDSRKAETTYRAVVDEYRGLCRIFTPEEMEQLSEIN